MSSQSGCSQDGWGIFTLFAESIYRTWWCLEISLPRPAKGGAAGFLVYLKLSMISMNHQDDFKDSGECFQKKGFSAVPTVLSPHFLLFKSTYDPQRQHAMFT